MKTKIKPMKPWLKLLIYLLEIVLLGSVIYLGSNFYSKVKDTKNIKIMSNQLIDAILPLTNILSKSAGNIHHHKYDHKAYIKPSLFYESKNKSHKLELILLNPSYSLIDCAGDLAQEIVYPLKISFIWQPMQQFADQYELICERHNNFQKLHNSKNIQRKVLLQHINAVKFKFLESKDISDETSEVNFINPRELHYAHNKQVAAVQIGMLVQSHNKAFNQEQYKNYHLFNKRINFLDRFLHRVIYITLQSSMT